ncbi:hypothetical protein L873DRAFT_1806522 [Choiromyces venosus 120613-1]|uniref:Uncharacterized protein n=1 Tax=Choiromyces venosus 120613-1 TaxID=1336337 RepID=A0A3N4K142_9PEZI|nr:hypothetical protein L873DRAFT_1806522 [Choiromyces venosus 120613-1]
MPLIEWLKTHKPNRHKKNHYQSFRTETSPPPLSRKNAPRLNTPNYFSPSNPHPSSRPVSPLTPSPGPSKSASPILSKGTSSTSSHTTSPLTPPESIHSEAQSWITFSETSRRKNRGSDIRLHRDSTSIHSVAQGERSQNRGRNSDPDRGRISGGIPTPPQTPIPCPAISSDGENDDDDDDDDGVRDHDNDYEDEGVYVYVPTAPDSDYFYPVEGRKEELVELFTLHGPVYGDEWRLRGAYDKIVKPRRRTAAKDIESENQELMNEYASGEQGYSEMWTQLLERS